MKFSEKGAWFPKQDTKIQTEKKVVQLKLLYNKTPKTEEKKHGRLRENYLHIKKGRMSTGQRETAQLGDRGTERQGGE